MPDRKGRGDAFARRLGRLRQPLRELRKLPRLPALHSPRGSREVTCARGPARGRPKSAGDESRLHDGARLRYTAPGDGTSSAAQPFSPPNLPPPAKDFSMINLAHLQPIVALIAGVLILIIPRLLNYIVAAYLIVVGLIGLGVIH